MTTFYIAIAMAVSTTSKLHGLSQIGKFDTPQAACEASARGEMTQVIKIGETLEECCDRNWLNSITLAAGCKNAPAGSMYREICPDEDMARKVILMNCVSAPSYRVEEAK